MARVIRLLKKVLIFVVAFSVFYFSWLPSGEFGEETHLPQWLLAWCNTYYNLRTAVPFVILSFLMTLRHKATHVILICFVLVTVAEFGQYFIPKRYPDYRDIFYGLLGTLFGILIALPFLKKSIQNQ